MKTALLLCAGLLLAPGTAARAETPDSSAVPVSVPLGTPPVASRKFWLAPANEGGWLAEDKRLHASLSFSAVVGLRAAGSSPGASLLGAAAIGIAKEAHDCLLRRPGPAQGFSRRDLVADAVGILAAGLALHFAVR
jgi:hypothetical protein